MELRRGMIGLDEVHDHLHERNRREEFTAGFTRIGRVVGDKELIGIAKEIDHLLRVIHLEALSVIAASLSEIKARIDGHTQDAQREAESFGSFSSNRLRTEIDRLFSQSEEEVAAAAPAPPTTPPASVRHEYFR